MIPQDAGMALMLSGAVTLAAIGLHLLVTNVSAVVGMTVVATVVFLVGYFLVSIEPPPIRHR